jgi:flagellar hook-associated protein 1 FlgK
VAISTALDIAARALAAQQAGLGVVGNNIANVDTPGYTRQVPVLQEDPTIFTGDGTASGNGVRVLNVQQVIDPLLERRRTAAFTDQGEESARSAQLSDLVGVENDVESPSLATTLSSFFDAADGLALRPASLVDRQTLLAQAATLADGFNTRSADIASIQRDSDAKIVDLVTSVNEDLDTIAKANVGIVHTQAGGQNANDLLDQRASALNDLSSILGVQTVTQPDGSLRVAGDSGVVLVDGGTVIHHLAVQQGAAGLDGQNLHDVTFIDGKGVSVAVPDSLARGQIAALLQVRDGDTVQASNNLDVLAAGLRDAVNAVQTAGQDLDGNATTLTPLFAGTGVAGAARTLSVAITDPRKVAAALATELPGSGNGNAKALASLRTTPLAALGNATATAYLSGEDGRLGAAASDASDRSAAADKFVAHLETERASVSGVNLNEELTNLLQYQHAFQAAAQVVTVTNATLDALVQMI